jgi:hypothetical protein
VYLQAVWSDPFLYVPQIAAVAIGLVAAATGVPRDLPRPFGVVTALVGVVALVLMKRWAAGDCLDEGACKTTLIVWAGLWFSAIAVLMIIAASAADLTRFLRQRRRSKSSYGPT